MRSAAIAFTAVFLAGVAALAALGLTRGSGLVYSPGVSPQNPVTEVPRGERACQGPIRSPDGAAFDRVGFKVGTLGAPGPPLQVEVLAAGSDRVLAEGSVPAGYADLADHVVPVGEVRTARPIRLCVTASRRIALFGQAGIASPQTTASVGGADIDVDFAFTLRSEERSLVTRAPAMAERAALFRAGWISPVAYLVLALAVIAAVPLLLARGLARAAAGDRDACAAAPDARSAATTAGRGRT